MTPFGKGLIALGHASVPKAGAYSTIVPCGQIAMCLSRGPGTVRCARCGAVDRSVTGMRLYTYPNYGRAVVNPWDGATGA
jgi:hypothetical protein